MAYVNPDPQNPIVLNVAVSTNLSPVDLERRFCKVSTGDTNLTTGQIVGITSDEIPDIFTGTYNTKETYLWLVNFFANNANGTAFVLEVGAVAGGDPGTNIAALATHITNGVDVCGHYSVPDSFYADADYATLVTLYATDDPIYKFSNHITHGTAPADQSAFAGLTGKSNWFPVYPSAVSTENACGAMVGIMASTVYDVSPTNLMTPLQYKKVVGVTAEAFNSTMRTALTNNAVNFVGSIQSVTVLMNGRYGDNKSWDYRFSERVTLQDIQNSLLALIINGANVPAASVPYNQEGIDKLLAVANSRGTFRKSCNMITDFSQTLDNTGTLLVDKDTFKATDYYTYKAANPTKYAAGEYDGLSGIIEIGKFFRKVTFNVTLM